MDKNLRLEETIFISYSHEDACWVAHGLRTDQIGTGAFEDEALRDAVNAIHEVMEIAATDPTIAYLREAPDDIQRDAITGRRVAFPIASASMGQLPQ